MMSHVNWIDYIIVIAILLSVVTGFFRGFAKELMAVIVWLISLWLAINYWPMLAEYFHPYLHDQTARMVVSFVAIVLSVFIAGGLVNIFLNLFLKRSGLTGTDRALGMGFGLVRGIFIVALVMLVLKMTGVSTAEEHMKKSYLYEKFNPLVNWMYGFAPILMSHMQVLDAGQSLDLRPDP